MLYMYLQKHETQTHSYLSMYLMCRSLGQKFYHSLGIQYQLSYIFLICGWSSITINYRHLWAQLPEDLPGTREQLLVTWSHLDFLPICFVWGGRFFGCRKPKKKLFGEVVREEFFRVHFLSFLTGGLGVTDNNSLYSRFF